MSTKEVNLISELCWGSSCNTCVQLSKRPLLDKASGRPKSWPLFSYENSSSTAGSQLASEEDQLRIYLPYPYEVIKWLHKTVQLQLHFLVLILNYQSPHAPPSKLFQCLGGHCPILSCDSSSERLLAYSAADELFQDTRFWRVILWLFLSLVSVEY